MKKRLQVTIGPNTAKIVTQLRRHYLKSTPTDWTDVDILETAMAHGLRFMVEKTKLEVPKIAHCRE